MCGISGIFSRQGGVSLEEVKKMNHKIAHRGPDDDSYFYNEYVALGHRRLSIIDLNERSNQPMAHEHLVIVFNGEIYNFCDIRITLLESGYSFETQGDCEVVLKAYHMWGEDCVNHFKGMWSFAVYDKRNAELFCSRDRFGIKPFYYKIDNDCLYFGSELKQLCADGCAPVMDNIIDYIAGGYVDHNKLTFFHGLFQLPPACNLKICAEHFEVKIERYFNLKDDSESFSGEEVKSLLDKSISEHMNADVKVGSCLSGGLDSSYVNYAALRSRPDSVAIHCNSSDHNFSEKDKAERVAQSLGISLEIIEPSLTEFKADLDELFYVQEQPFGDPSVYMQYSVMQKASALGIKVMLDGQGADEVFMGYSKYLGIRLWDDFSIFSPRKFFHNFRESLRNNNLSVINLIMLMFGTKYERLKRIGLLLKSRIPLRYWSRFIKQGESSRSGSAFQFSEIYEYPLQTLLRNEDRNSMYFSIEARVPYLDHELVGKLYLESVVNKVSEGWSKKLLRDLSRGCLPHDISYRKDKLGFNSPPSWLDKISYTEIYDSKILKEIFGGSIKPSWVVKLDPKLKWRLLSIAIWERVFKVSLE